MSLYSWKDDVLFKDKFLPLTSGITLVGPERLYILYQIANQVKFIGGVFAEVGVYKGGTARLLYEVLYSYMDDFYLYDTFDGMPECNDKLDKHHKGDFSDTSLDKIKDMFKSCDEVNIIKGKFPETAVPSNSLYSMIHIDCDIYQSVKDCCEHFYSLMLAGGIMVFDDYGFPSCPGAKKAVDEFFEDKLETPISLPTGQCIVVKLGV